MDKIFIQGLQIPVHLGVTSSERQDKQIIRIDIELAIDVTKVAAMDNLADTVDYFAVSQRVFNYVSSTTFQLIETLAEYVANVILREFAVPWIALKITKIPKDMPNVQAVGVAIERER